VCCLLRPCIPSKSKQVPRAAAQAHGRTHGRTGPPHPSLLQVGQLVTRSARRRQEGSTDPGAGFSGGGRSRNATLHPHIPLSLHPPERPCLDPGHPWVGSPAVVVSSSRSSRQQQRQRQQQQWRVRLQQPARAWPETFKSNSRVKGESPQDHQQLQPSSAAGICTHPFASKAVRFKAPELEGVDRQKVGLSKCNAAQHSRVLGVLKTGDQCKSGCIQPGRASLNGFSRLGTTAVVCLAWGLALVRFGLVD